MKTKPANKMTMAEFMVLLKTACDAGRADKTGCSGVTITDDGTGWFHGERFHNLDEMMAILRLRADAVDADQSRELQPA